MKPMEPMKPMAPMEPMQGQKPWWPGDLGEPSTSGGQNELKYAYFGDANRLAVSRGGKVTVYDSGSHQINGVAQSQGAGDDDLRFSTADGEVAVGSLKAVG